MMSSRCVRPSSANWRTSSRLTPSRSRSGPEPFAPPSASATDGRSSRRVSPTVSPASLFVHPIRARSPTGAGPGRGLDHQGGPRGPVRLCRECRTQPDGSRADGQARRRQGPRSLGRPVGSDRLRAPIHAGAEVPSPASRRGPSTGGARTARPGPRPQDLCQLWRPGTTLTTARLVPANGPPTMVTVIVWEPGGRGRTSAEYAPARVPCRLPGT